MNLINDNPLHKAIIKAIEDETNRIVEEEAKASAKRVEERIRAQVGGIATRICQMSTFEFYGTQLRITVDFPDKGSNK